MAAFTGPCGLWPEGGSQLQTYLNTTENDTKRICLLESINKMSKYKPVDYPQYEDLTESQMRYPSGTASGIIYGVKVSFTSTKLSDVHDFSFEYKRPTSYFRLNDFYRYDKNATADVSCYLGFETIYRDVSATSTVYIDVDYLGNNTTGLPIKSEIKSALSMSAETDEVAFSHVYPFILVDDYLCALSASSTAVDVKPICYNNEWRRTFYCDFGKLHDTYGLALGDVKVSLLLVGTYNADTVMAPYLDGEWHNMGGIDVVTLSRPFYPCPPETGMTIEVKDYGRYAPDIILSMPTTAASNGISLYYSFEETPIQDVEIEFEATISPNAPSTKYVTYYSDPSATAVLPRWSWRDLGFLSVPANGTILQLSITATYHYVGVPQSVKTTTATSTITVTDGSGGVIPLG